MPTVTELIWEHVYQPVCVHDGGIVTSIERGRDPCWWRVLDECGIGFGFGIVLGLGMQTYQGCKMAAPGKRWRVIKDRIITQCPANGGSFAAWTTAFSVTECSVIKLRGGTEDLINPIMAGAGAGAFTNLSGGRREILHGARTGALLLGVMELAMSSWTAYSVNSQLMQAQVPSPPETLPDPDVRYSKQRRIKEFQWAPPVPMASNA
eukprot:TRINITY_DN3803_c0_g1_i1.p1 TRINITY_DN3803_c0_g1~~TRINITY_DN3803_c0_g1_i1.p1  ORF type:complete len:226 (+),score=26.39 TRINITY_DN3803_c0_g1_i1:59-679(+)